MVGTTTVSLELKVAERHLLTLIAKYGPELQTLIRAVRKAMRKLFPTALELVYDYSSSLVISYSPTERGIESVVAIAAGADGLRLVFNSGPTLPDPKNLLLGSGKMTRFIWIESVKTLTRPEVRALIASATARMKVPFPESGRGQLIIKSGSKKPNPRRRGMK